MCNDYRLMVELASVVEEFEHLKIKIRFPEERPCECDMYLTCAKFVTTPEYAPRLRERRLREMALADDAEAKGIQREAERHECTRRRIKQLLTELGEQWRSEA